MFFGSLRAAIVSFWHFLVEDGSSSSSESDDDCLDEDGLQGYTDRIMLELQRKQNHPRRLHPELWYDTTFKYRVQYLGQKKLCVKFYRESAHDTEFLYYIYLYLYIYFYKDLYIYFLLDTWVFDRSFLHVFRYLLKRKFLKFIVSTVFYRFAMCFVQSYNVWESSSWLTVHVICRLFVLF